MEIVAIYARVSQKDNTVAVTSGSLKNQILLAEKYIKQDNELNNMEQRIFMDDGYSGSDMDRPAVRRMLAGIFIGNVQAVVIKDFSRLSRNHIDISRLLEFIFPKYHTVIISVAEEYDSRKRQIHQEDVLRNIFNEYYCRDISRKTGKSLLEKRKSGKYISARPPYGYRKNGDSLEVDQQEAEIVRLIYRLSASGKGSPQIAEILNQQGMKKRKKRWQYPDIWRILHDPVYLGNAVYNRSRNEFRDRFVTVYTPRNAWGIVPQNHPPLIEKKQYELCQKLHPATAGYGKKKGKRHVFHGITKCGICGKALCRHRSKNNLLVCSGGGKHAEITISMSCLWKICMEIFAFDPETSGEKSRRIFLENFISQIVVDNAEIRIMSKVLLENKGAT